MSTLEQASMYDEVPDFGMSNGFDINAAFQEAMQSIATDSEIALEERTRRMAVVISEGSSEIYRDFVDFRHMAAQMEMMCLHDHALNQSMQGNDTLSSFMSNNKADDSHNHKDDDEYEIDLKTGKKKKKKRKLPYLT